MEVSREERHTDVAQESSPSQASSYVGRTHVRDMCRWGGFLVAEIQVRVERAGAESQLTPVYSSTRRLPARREVSDALGRMGEKQSREHGYGTGNTGLLSQFQLLQMPSLPRWSGGL